MHEKSKWFRQQQLTFNFCWRKHCRGKHTYFVHFEAIVTEMLNCFSFWQIKATSKTTHCDFVSPSATSYVSIAQLTGAKRSMYVYIKIYILKIDIQSAQPCILYHRRTQWFYVVQFFRGQRPKGSKVNCFEMYRGVNISTALQTIFMQIITQTSAPMQLAWGK